MRDDKYNLIHNNNLISPMSGVYIPKGNTLELPIDITLSGYDRYGVRFPDNVEKSIEIYNSSMDFNDISLIDYTDVKYEDIEEYDEAQELELMSKYETEKCIGEVLSINYHKKTATIKFTETFMTNYNRDYELLYIYPMCSNVYYIELYNYAESKGYPLKLSEETYMLRLMNLELDGIKVLDTEVIRKSTNGIVQRPFEIKSFGIEVVSKEMIAVENLSIQQIWKLERELLPISFIV